MRVPPRILLPKGKHGYIYTDASSTRVIWLVIFVSLFILSQIKTLILPAYFFSDASTIDGMIAARATFGAADSYASTAAFFQIFGFRNSSAVLPILAFAVILPAYMWGLTTSIANKIRMGELAIVLFCFALSIVYMTVLSKDIIVLILVMLFAVRPARWPWLWLVLWLCLASLYGYYFRTYWFIVIAIFLTLRVFFSISRKPILVWPVVFITLFALAFVMQVKLGVSMDSFRTSINDVRVQAGDVNARTMIMPFIGGGSFMAGYLNVCITLFTLIVPVPLLLLGSPYYIMIFMLILLLHVNFFRGFSREVRQGSHSHLLECACLVISYLAVQSMFEPDYGSYVRHLSPFYCLMLGVWLNRPDTI
ncbi:general stress protein CsbA [Paraburkholderia sp. GAS199]|uniref:hypothetical protein n=1 Tax=Paraburkholderia sp. GAS199 TaxID=3035126 RepID=UPI003D1DF8D7